jgi:hypothetical protein
MKKYHFVSYNQFGVGEPTELLKWPKLSSYCVLYYFLFLLAETKLWHQRCFDPTAPCRYEPIYRALPYDGPTSRDQQAIPADDGLVGRRDPNLIGWTTPKRTRNPTVGRQDTMVSGTEGGTSFLGLGCGYPTQARQTTNCVSHPCWRQKPDLVWFQSLRPTSTGVS